MADEVVIPALFTKNRAHLVANVSNSFHCYSRIQRAAVVKALVEKIELNYSLLRIKKKTIGLNFDKISQQAYDAEIAVQDAFPADKSTKEKNLICAERNFAFFDRVKIFLAKFKDTHLWLGYGAKLLSIHSGFYIKKVIYEETNEETKETIKTERYVVHSINEKMITYIQEMQPVAPALNKDSKFSQMKVGVEVLEIDGKAISEVVKELKPYVEASSDSYSDNAALYNVTSRNYKFPTKNYMKVKIRIPVKNKFTDKSQEVAFHWPWFYQRMSKAGSYYNRPDQLLYFDEYKFNPIDPAYIQYDEVYNEFSYYEGVPPVNKRHLGVGTLMEKVVYSYEDEPTMISGFISKNRMLYGYLFFDHFHSSGNVLKSNKGSFLKFIKAFETEISRFKEKGVPLILDLRSNTGGSTWANMSILKALTPENSSMTGMHEAYRLTPFVYNAVNYYGQKYIEAASEVDIFIDDIVIKELLHEAHTAKKDHTKAYMVGRHTPSKDVEGYSQEIVTLVSPDCISSCDLLAMTLQFNKRAKLIGTQTNGTGAGFASFSNVSSTWVDNYDIFRIKIPNMLFGVAGTPEEEGSFIFKESAVDLNSENKPTIADVKYQTTYEDVINDSEGWIATAIKELDAMEAAKEKEAAEKTKKEKAEAASKQL